MPATTGKRQRSTRLSSGSVKRRSYVETKASDDEAEGPSSVDGADDTDSEQDFKLAKRGKRGAKDGAARAETPSSDEFRDGSASDDDVEEEEEDDDDDDDGDAALDESGEDEEPVAVKAPKRAKAKVAAGVNEEIIEVVKAPKGKAPRGRLSPHLLSFLRDMKDPAKNDRDWFAANKNVYDYVYQNWLDFVDASTEEMMEKVDDTIPWLPPKTLVERIYRDVRFSNDKTPYKKHFSWCLSRNGRKGNFAKYYLAVSAGSSGLHAGMYEPGKEDLQAIRDAIVTNTAHGIALRNLVKDKEFCKQFGSPPKGPSKTPKRTSLWGAEDELKRAPKNYSPDHADIAWLKLKHFTVSHSFSDDDVLADNFMERVLEVARAAEPLVSIMNEILHGIGPTVPADEA